MIETSNKSWEKMVPYAWMLLALVVAVPCFGQQTDELSIALDGCRMAADSVKTGKGSLVVEYSKNGITLMETVSKINLAFSGSRYKAYEDALYLKNDLAPDAKSDLMPKPYPAGTRLVREFARNTDDLTMLWPSDKRAEVTSMQLQSGRSQDSYFQVRAAIIGHGVMRIDATTDDASLRVVGHDTVDGDDCIVVERAVKKLLPSGDIAVLTQLFWVDPSKGYTVPRLQIWAQGGDQKDKALALEASTDLKDYGNGVWGPAKWTCQAYRRNSAGDRVPDYRIVVTYDSGFALNNTVTDDDLSLAVPSGTVVQNELLGESYAQP